MEKDKVVVFLIPQNKIDQLIQYKDWLTQKQKEQILSAVQSGGQLVINPTVKQRGGFLGSLLASIGIPLALEMGSKLFGKGLTLPRKAGHGLMTMPKPPPPFYGNWEGRGNKKGRGLLLGPNSPFQNSANLLIRTLL